MQRGVRLIPWRSAAALLAVAALVLLESCGCEREKPCIEWAKQGETFTVELVQHLEFTEEDDVLPPGYVVPPRTCGTALDIVEGNVVMLTPTAKVDWSRDDQCREGCYWSAARASLPNVTTIAERRGEPHLSVPFLVAQADVRVGESCTGSHAIHIIPLDSYFLEHSDAYVATDHILVRRFGTSDSGCPAEGSQIYDADEYWGSCWDAWAVRIRDSSGQFVTSDLPSPPAGSQSGGSDSGRPTNDDDGGSS